jgi:hypothetical protein
MRQIVEGEVTEELNLHLYAMRIATKYREW